MVNSSKSPEVEMLSAKDQMHMVQVSHLVHKGGTKPNVNITIAFLGRNYPETVYGMSNSEFGANFEENRN